MQRLNRGRARPSGFTLVELAVVVLVITLLLGSLLIPLATQVDQRNVAETQKRLQEVKEALLGYAMANGRFPCPAVSAAPTDTGVEVPPTAAATGVCTNFFGYVPGITLGLSNLDSQGFVVDAWGLQQNRIRYAITNRLTNAFTKQSGMRGVGIQGLGTPTSLGGTAMLYVCASSTGATATDCGSAANTLSNGDTVFIVYSLGRNAATSGATGVASPDEQLNLNGVNPVFVSRTTSTQVGGEFDDILLYSSRSSIISQMTVAGQLP